MTDFVDPMMCTYLDVDPYLVPDADEATIKQFAFDWLAGTIWPFNEQTRECFMLMALIPDEDRRALAIGNVGLIYEHVSNAGPRAINGKPVFLSARMLNRSDVDRVSALVVKLAAALDPEPENG